MVDVIALIKEVGKEEGERENAKRMLARQMDHQTIAELSLEDVAKIEREMKP